MTDAIQIQTHQPKLKPVTMTQSAIEYVTKEIQQKFSEPDKKQTIGFRLYLTTAGCSGMMYKVDIVNTINPDDFCFPASDLFKIYIDAKAYPFVQGTEIDFVTEGLNKIFKYNNPNETASCGCGESFTIDDRFDHEE